MPKQEPTKPKLNKDLCPEEFKICVPRSCKLLGYNWEDGDGKPEKQWEDYLRTLTPNQELPTDYKKPTDCWTCDCQKGWELHGKLAVAHACRVHDKIHRQALGFEQVSAVDVGFAMWERQTKFRNFLTIRIHVNRKLPPEQLARAGFASFTELAFAAAERGDRSVNSITRLHIFDLATQEPPGPLQAGVNTKKLRRLRKLLKEELRGRENSSNLLGRYPISGVRLEDLSIFCPPEEPDPLTPDTEDASRRLLPREDEPRTIEDIRLCICGVPIDIVNARYNPSVIHPGGDADSGVFVDPPQRSNQLKNDEHLLIGRGRVNPLVGGVSIGSVTGQAGTLGTIVWDRTDGTPCVLSNWHVLAGNATAQVDQPTYQPALFDGGTEDDVVAHLKRWHLGEEGDAAIAEVSNKRHYASGEVLGMWHPISGYMPPSLNMKIRKWGRTTGFTRGFVDGVHLATNIDYGNGVVRYFKQQFHIAPLYVSEDVSQVGDSGSLVLTSIRPDDLQEDLAKLCKWLLSCCEARNGESLCRQIATIGELLLERCEDRCPSSTCASQFCTILDTAISKFNATCAAGHYQELCDLIEKYHATLSEVCSDITSCGEFCRDVDDIFEDWYELSKQCSSNACEICDRIEQDAAEITSAGSESQCNSFYEATARAIEILKSAACGTDPKREHLCRAIKEQRDSLRATCGSIITCADFCTETVEILRRWHEKCSSITEGKKQCDKLCQILEKNCQRSLCKDPGALIDCIEQNLCTDNAQNKKPGHELTEESVKNLLATLVPGMGHDPAVLLAELKGTARRYYRRKKDESDRSTARVYYAVGLIYAGDTPGSPFGEFAVASDIERLADKLRFSLRPVFEPRSSFRELRVRPPSQGQVGRAPRSRRSLTPGTQGADSRGGGPQPDLEPAQSGSGSGGG